MFSLINPRARSSANSTDRFSTGQFATQPASSFTGGENNEVAEPAAAHKERYPYLVLVMLAAI
jgi:hypothetical protein